MLSYSAPGKLFISGEWAILEVGNHGLVAAVNNRVHVSLEGTVEDILITAAKFGVREVHAKYAEGKLHIDADDKQKETLKLLGEALSTSLRFLGENSIMPKPFHIITSSKDTQFEVGGQLKKVGFGSSAALVVSAIAAVLDLLYEPTKNKIACRDNSMAKTAMPIFFTGRFFISISPNPIDLKRGSFFLIS